MVDLSPKRIATAWLAPKPQTSATKYLLADDLAAVKSFAARQGLSVKERDDAFFVPLSTTMHPPEFNRDLTYDDVRGLIEAHTATETYQSLICWLREARLPITLLLSMPLTAPQGQALIAVIVKPAKGEARKRALRGYRPDHVPAGRELRFAHDQPVTKLAVERFDPGFVLARGGATEQLLARSVAIVGCGAVGSHAVNHLAMLGIGNLRLVDPDILTSENIYRHVLGAAYVGYSKVQGLKIELERRLPQVTIEIRATDVEKVLRAEPEFIMAADLIVIAVGDETLERRLNAILADLRPRIHTWVEPLGIGGHVLATGIAAGSGCYDCLFENEATYGLVNRADLAAPGQSFQKSMAGCAGMYMPFAALDADRIASETARLVTRSLTGQEHQNVLMGVAGDVTAFTAAGFSLSARGRRLREAVWQRETRHARTDCPVCGEWGS
jgi:molybdopterin/thiamine biosynthesis adenylyltransferase